MNSNRMPISKKPYCKVCHTAGKSEKEYTSHYTKTVPGPKGIVICPTILNNECSYCRKKGHFKNSCPVLFQKSKNETNQKKMVEPSIQPPPYANLIRPIPIRKTNLFSELFCDSDDEEEEKSSSPSQQMKIVEDFPSLVAPKKTEPISFKMSFASVVALPPPPLLQKIEESEEEDEEDVDDDLSSNVSCPVKKRDIHHDWSDDIYWSEEDDHPVYNKNLSHDWADDEYWSDSE